MINKIIVKVFLDRYAKSIKMAAGPFIKIHIEWKKDAPIALRPHKEHKREVTGTTLHNIVASIRDSHHMEETTHEQRKIVWKALVKRALYDMDQF